MKKKTLITVLLTAAIAIPVGAFADAWGHHAHLRKAHEALNLADAEINESQRANEGVWGDEGGHGQRAKQLIHDAKVELDRAAQWVENHK